MQKQVIGAEEKSPLSAIKKLFIHKQKMFP